MRAFGGVNDDEDGGEQAVGESVRPLWPMNIVLTEDGQMLEIDSHQATQKICPGKSEAGCKGLPIIAMTGNAMAGDRERCLESGMDDHLVKPANEKRGQQSKEPYLEGAFRRPNGHPDLSFHSFNSI